MSCRLVIFVGLLAVASAVNLYVRPVNNDCVKNIDTNSAATTLFPSEFQANGSSVVNGDGYTTVINDAGFSITYYDTYKVVNDSLSGTSYVLTQCGFPTPNDLPAERTFSIPLSSVSVPETVSYPFFELLGITDRVYDVSEYVVSPCGQRLLDECGRASPNDMDLSNDTLLTDTIGPYTDGIINSSPLNWTTQFTFSNTFSPSLLGRVQWIKYLGAFFNLDAYASHIYDAIVTEYDAEKAKVAATEGDVPLVAWASHYVYGTDESYQLSFADYKNELAEAAGGVILNMTELLDMANVTTAEYSTSTVEFGWQREGQFSSKAAALQAFLDVLESVDVLIDETYTADPTTYNFTAFLAQYSDGDVQPSLLSNWYASNRVLREDGLISPAPSYGWDWFEGAIARPGKVLLDLVSTTRPAAIDGTHRPIWLRHIYDSPTIVGPEDCTIASNGCTGASNTICPFISFCGNGTPVLLKTNLTTGALPEGSKCEYEACPAA